MGYDIFRLVGTDLTAEEVKQALKLTKDVEGCVNSRTLYGNCLIRHTEDREPTPFERKFGVDALKNWLTMNRKYGDQKEILKDHNMTPTQEELNKKEKRIEYQKARKKAKETGTRVPTYIENPDAVEESICTDGTVQ